jgi:hypothetical protein
MCFLASPADGEMPVERTALSKMLSAQALALLGCRLPLHTGGNRGRDIYDAEGDLLFIGPPKDGAAERAEAFVRMVNMQHEKLATAPVVPARPAYAALDAGFHSAAAE